MKKIYFLLPLLVFTLVFTSCNKDDDPVDPCEGVTCLNDGVCVNGDCDCPDGYTGPSCGDQITPLKMKISQIEVTSFPQYDNGETWDFGSGPDIYIIVAEYENSTFGDVLHTQNSTWDNALNQPYTYTPNSNIVLNDPTSGYAILLIDYDTSDEDDFMGGISFTPYSNSNAFPTTLELSNGELSFKLTVSYIW